MDNILEILHPDFKASSLFMNKFRLCYEGGQNFIRSFLHKYSNREDEVEFRKRKLLSYCPAFAKAGINEIRNAIVQRFPDISRSGGSTSYLEACGGLNGGVNLQGSSMNLFLGEKVIPELLIMAKVGVYIDMPPIVGLTLVDQKASRPYIYIYKAEQIRSWAYDPQNPDRLLAILLEDSNYDYDPNTGLITGTIIHYRHMWINENGNVSVQFYDLAGVVQKEVQELKLKTIPFVIQELPESLLLDVVDYQIALLNLESSDLAYILKSNYPFYTEQFDVKSESPYIKQPEQNEVEIGAGRRYPVGTERPGFIHPSSEPLKISIDKENQLKNDIRLLINLAVINLGSSGETTSNNLLEAGLSLIGLKIESLEKRIAGLWATYESEDVTTIVYPETYSLKSEEERRKEAEELSALIPKVPSKTYQKELAKQIARVTIGHKIDKSSLQKIEKEIDASAVIVSDPDVISTDLENGLVSVELASKIRGYPEGQVEQAKIDHAQRIERIAIAQSQGAAASRGVGDLSGDAKGPAAEKTTSRDTTSDSTVTDKTRGTGK